jgi:putative peptidoglycan lipid II flippase
VTEAPRRPDRRPAGRNIARNTLIFSVATGLSRVAGLAREVLASYYFGTTGAFSAFTIANQIPNVVRSFFADAALSAAFVPVFTEHLERGERREAFRLASTLLLLIGAVLGAVTLLFAATAHWVVPLFLAEDLAPFDSLATGLSIVLFPTVLLLALNGVLVGMLQAHDHFTVPALSPVVWNVVIMTVLVTTVPIFDGEDELYGYALGILAGTVVQLGMALPVLRRIGFRFTPRAEWSPKVRQVLVLMLPITVALGLINVGALIASVIAGAVDEQGPRAIEAAFRIYMLPQGLFSVAIATVLFPALSRLAARRDIDGLRDLVGTGTRQILLTLVPAAAILFVLAEPITRLVFQRGAFDAESTRLTSEALLVFSLSLPFNGVNLLFTRTFFSLQQPWGTTTLAAASLVVQVAVSIPLAALLGVGGVVGGIAIGTALLVIAQGVALRRILRGLATAPTITALGRILGASGWLAATSYGVWRGLDALLGTSLPAQLVSVGTALAAGSAVYVAIVLWLRVPEARQIQAMVARRLPSRGT